MQLPPTLLRLARAHRRQLARLEDGARAALDRQWRIALRDMDAQLSRPELLSEHHTAQLTFLRAIMRASLEHTDAAMLRVLRVALHGAALRGGADAGAEIAAWLKHYGAEARTIDLVAASELAEGLLLERLKASRAAWGALHAQAVRTALVQGVIQRTPREELVRNVRDVLGARAWQARRIVRTELSTAYHAGHLRGLREARDDHQLAVKKTAIVTLDLRTGQDSLALRGQVRELEELFQDGAGRRYLSPPGRPNDREKQVAWMDPLD